MSESITVKTACVGVNVWDLHHCSEGIYFTFHPPNSLSLNNKTVMSCRDDIIVVVVVGVAFMGFKRVYMVKSGTQPF